MKKQKNIIILTIHRAINYGALLQSFALQKVIQKIGDEGLLLNYWPKELKNRYSVCPKIDRGIRTFFIDIAYMPIRIINHAKFGSFRKKYLLTSKNIKNKNEISYFLRYKSFIVGSDQVWNYNITRSDNTYFGDFIEDTNIQKYSYASSFGVEKLDEKVKSNYKKKLKSFKQLSIREKSGIKILNELGYDGQQNIDPTLLLSGVEWRDTMLLEEIPNNYVLIYTIGQTKEIIDFAKKIALKENLDVVYLAPIIKPISGVKVVRCASPRKWLTYFYNAKYIITNSFHGVAFSINFNKEFYYKDAEPCIEDTNSRLLSLMELVQINGRSLYEDINKKINWSCVNRILDNERIKAFEYLEDIVKECKC